MSLYKPYQPFCEVQSHTDDLSDNEPKLAM